MQVLGLLGMYFDAVVVEVEKYLLFFRLALAILCIPQKYKPISSVHFLCRTHAIRTNLTLIFIDNW